MKSIKQLIIQFYYFVRVLFIQPSVCLWFGIQNSARFCDFFNITLHLKFLNLT